MLVLLVACSQSFGDTAVPTEAKARRFGNVVAVDLVTLDLSEGWAVRDDVPGFAGESYLCWEGGNAFESPASGRLKVPVEIPQSDRYELRLWNYHDNSDPSQGNDVWVSVDGTDGVEPGAIKVYSNEGASSVGTWNPHSDLAKASHPGHQQPAAFDLNEGEHAFTRAGRSDGFCVDHLVLYPGGTAPASVLERYDYPDTGSEGESDDAGGVGPGGNCDFKPDATNTGPSDPAALAPLSGSQVVTTDGAVLEDFELVGGIIRVEADDVTIRNFRIDAGNSWYATRMYAHDGGNDAFKMDGNNLLDHSFTERVGSEAGSHADSVQIRGATDVMIRCRKHLLPGELRIRAVQRRLQRTLGRQRLGRWHGGALS